MRHLARLNKLAQMIRGKRGWRWTVADSEMLAGMAIATYGPPPGESFEVYATGVLAEVNAVAEGWGGEKVTLEDLQPLLDRRRREGEATNP